jgi:hypothetical protein
MPALTIVEAVLLVVAIVYIVALLRSHADILRRLAALENGAAGPPRAVSSAPAGDHVVRAAEISGVTLGGDVVTLAFGGGSPVTLLAFLTSGCASCAPLWTGLRESGQAAALADRVVVVTHDPTRESPARLRSLAPTGVEVVMASAAWDDYAVPASPHFVLTDGAGGILGRGSALSWSQLLDMVGDARADADGVSGALVDGVSGALVDGVSGLPADGVGEALADGVGGAPARTTAERAARSEQTLARSGIGPGHPSLYPSATVGQDEGDR